MKYIITESRLENIVFKYLDMKYGALEQKMGKYTDIVFTFPGEEYGLLGWEKSGNLYVYNEINDEISNYFGLRKVDSLKVIGKWVEDRHNLKVINTHHYVFLRGLIVEDRHNLKIIIT
jgi:hypothetical protein